MPTKRRVDKFAQDDRSVAGKLKKRRRRIESQLERIQSEAGITTRKPRSKKKKRH